MIGAVVFDLDGVIVSSEEVWDEVRQALTHERGGRWAPEAHRVMMGMSTPEWTAYMRDDLGVPMTQEEIVRELEGRLITRYERDLPLIPGAVDAVRALSARHPLGLASSSTGALIAAVLRLAGLTGDFRVTVSSEEVPRGKPAPDVYLRALELLGVAPAGAVAVEDSTAGIRAAAAAGMRVVAIPNRIYPPEPEGLALADVVLACIGDLTPEALPA